ncbi:Uncharacterized protein APZ42_033154 [Daphnia magna]|uniref:Uncharacterized protein n=1 Tax=Daphnia magna TaxID=35525 RepID=A0A0P6C238_9CRUS|nr:Uncharacterized protein APZ42_033154 [Daphnia magna]
MSSMDSTGFSRDSLCQIFGFKVQIAFVYGPTFSYFTNSSKLNKHYAFLFCRFQLLMLLDSHFVLLH